MEVGADLDGPVTRIGNFQFNFAPPVVRDHHALGQNVFAWNHLSLSTPVIARRGRDIGSGGTGFSLCGFEFRLSH
jgi:hypothetical protein